MNNDQRNEPSAQAIYRKLKAEGYVPTVSADGKVMISVSEEVSDIPSPNIANLGLDDPLHLSDRIGL